MGSATKIGPARPPLLYARNLSRCACSAALVSRAISPSPHRWKLRGHACQASKVRNETVGVARRVMDEQA